MLPHEAMVISWPGCLLRTVSGSMVLLQVGSLSMSVAPSYHQRTLECLWCELSSETMWMSEGHVASGTY